MIKVKLGFAAIVLITVSSLAIVAGVVATDPKLPGLAGTKHRGSQVILYASNSSNDTIKVKWRVTSNIRGVLDSSVGDTGDWMNSPFYEEYWLRTGETVRIIFNAGVNFKLVSNVVTCSVRTNIHNAAEDSFTKERSSPTPDVSCPATIVNE